MNTPKIHWIAQKSLDDHSKIPLTENVEDKEAHFIEILLQVHRQKLAPMTVLTEQIS
jgi:hypothetical protein